MERKSPEHASQLAVDRAAEKLLAAGIRPTVQRVHETIGGSARKLRPLLENWWKRLADRSTVEELPQQSDGTVEERAEILVRQAIDSARFSLRDRIRAAKKQLAGRRGKAALGLNGDAGLVISHKEFEHLEHELHELHSMVLDHLTALADARAGFAAVEKRLADLYGALRLTGAPRATNKNKR